MKLTEAPALANTKGETMKFFEFIDSLLEDDNKKLDNFYVINHKSEDNKDYSIQNSDVAGLSNFPTLLVMDNNSNTAGHFGITVPEALEEEIGDTNGIVTKMSQIINVLLGI